MAQQLEGTMNSGENEVSQYLSNQGVSNDTIQKLIQNELNTVYVQLYAFLLCM